MFGNAYFGASYFGPTYFGPDGLETSGGTTKDWRYKFTKEHLRELEQFGLVRDGVILEEDIPKVKEVIEVESLEEYSESLSDLFPIEQAFTEITILETESIGLQEKIADEDDIGLILAIIEAHEL